MSQASPGEFLRFFPNVVPTTIQDGLGETVAWVEFNGQGFWRGALVFAGKVIAEVGSVHDGSFGNALKLIDLAKTVGADAVKFQTHLADFEVTHDAKRPEHFRAETRLEYFRRTGFTLGEWSDLKAHADGIGLTFLSSVFCSEAVDLLDEIGVAAHKIPSGEVSHLSLLTRVAQSGKPILLSTGMSDWSEINTALETLRNGGAEDIWIFQCTSLYPCPPEHVGLNVVRELDEKSGGKVGFSDHTDGPAASIAAVASGAQVVEKHLTFSKAMYGSDAPYATEPGPFRQLVKALREVWEMRKNPVDKNNIEHFLPARETFQAVALTSRALPKGHIIGEEDIIFRKAGEGISGSNVFSLVGSRLYRDKGALEKFEPADLR